MMPSILLLVPILMMSKEKNAEAGLSYNEVKKAFGTEWWARYGDV